MTLDSTTRRLLTGSSYEFAKAVRAQLASTTDDQAITVEQHAVDAATQIIRHVYARQTDWHIHRGIETIHHADWLWRRAQRLTNGPEMPNIDNAGGPAENAHTHGHNQNNEGGQA